MINVLVVDDHVLIREGLKKILHAEADINLIGEAENAQEMYSILNRRPCDILVLDISLPDRNGLDLIKDLKMRYKDLNIIILSMHPEERFALRALKSGALSYINKESAPSELVQAIFKASEGRQYITPQLGESLASSLVGNSEEKLHEKLSDREYQVLCQIGSGRTVSQIADELSLSISTVNTYRQRILQKLDMKTNLELIHYTIKNNLID